MLQNITKAISKLQIFPKTIIIIVTSPRLQHLIFFPRFLTLEHIKTKVIFLNWFTIFLISQMHMRKVLIFLIFQVVGLRSKTISKMPKGSSEVSEQGFRPRSFCGTAQTFKPSACQACSGHKQTSQFLAARRGSPGFSPKSMLN